MVGAHGVGGNLRLSCELPWEELAPTPSALRLLLSLAAQRRLQGLDPALAARAEMVGKFFTLELAVTAARPVAGGVLVSFAGLEVREVADSLRGAEVCLPRASLPACAPGEFWCFELQDMVARDEGGQLLGSIFEVVEVGGQVLATLRGIDGRQAPVPIVPAVVRRVDHAAGEVVMRLPEGLWELSAVAG